MVSPKSSDEHEKGTVFGHKASSSDHAVVIVARSQSSSHKSCCKSLTSTVWGKILVAFIILALLAVVIVTPILLTRDKDEETRPVWMHPDGTYDFDYLRAAANKSCQVYCFGHVLNGLSMSGVDEDNKVTVDRPLKVDPLYVVGNYTAQYSNTVPPILEVQDFLKTYFSNTTEALVIPKLEDYNENPAFLGTIKNSTLRMFAQDLVKMWPAHARQASNHLLNHPELHSHMPLPFPFIESGGRREELHYFDSYFIVKGLLACDMNKTAKNVIKNIEFMRNMSSFGLVPHASRVYYWSRTASPFFTGMVHDLYEHSNNSLAVVSEFYNSLRSDWQWWTERRALPIKLSDHTDYLFSFSGQGHTNLPRPENYRWDVYTQAASEQGGLYRNLHQATESSWGVSSRFKFSGDLSLNTTLNYDDLENGYSQTQVDLFAFMAQSERQLREMAVAVGNKEDARLFHEALQNRRHTNDEFNYDATRFHFTDSKLAAENSMDHGTLTNRDKLSLANYVAFGIRGSTSHPETKVEALTTLEELSLQNLFGAAGFSLTNTDVGLEGDGPNLLPHMQYFLSKSLFALDRAAGEGTHCGQEVARRFLKTVYEAYYNHPSEQKALYDRYDAYAVGATTEFSEPGSALTLGVALALIKEWGPFISDLDTELNCTLKTAESAYPYTYTPPPPP